MNNKEICIINCYARTENHRKEIFKHIEYIRIHYRNQNIIIAGDFNKENLNIEYF